MVSYLQAENISRRIGDNLLFENISLNINKEDKAALIAVNGALPVMITPHWVSVPAHPIAVPDLLEYLLAAEGWPGGESRVFEIGGADVVSYGDLQTFALSLDPYDPDRKIRDMDAAGIDVSVLTVNIPAPELLTPELGIEGARVCNDYLAELSARYPGRFVGLATLPLQDVGAAMTEYRRAIHDLGLRGSFLFSHVAGKPLDAPEFEPLYAAAERDQTPLVLHPTVPTWAEVVKDYSMIPMIGLMMDTSIAMLRLIAAVSMSTANAPVSLPNRVLVAARKIILSVVNTMPRWTRIPAASASRGGTTSDTSVFCQRSSLPRSFVTSATSVPSTMSPLRTSGFNDPPNPALMMRSGR